MTLYVHVAGRLGHSAEMSYVGANNTAKCEFSLASDDYDKDAPNKRRTRWYKCTLWGNRGVALSQYLKKGIAVTVHGTHAVRQYQRKDGGEGLSEDIEVTAIDLQGSSSNDAGNTQEAADAKPATAPAQASRRAPEPKPAPAAPAQATQPPAAASFDDDIPF